MKLWGGRFEGGTDDLMNAFNASISYDKRMWKADIEGSKMYAAALENINIINRKELDLISQGQCLIYFLCQDFVCIYIQGDSPKC